MSTPPTRHPPDIPDWEQRYRDQSVETMPWYYPSLDPDFERALTQLGLQSGKALDLGTGPATQAIALARRGFDVTGADVSPTAVAHARALAAEQGQSIRFVEDNVLDSRMDERFDLVVDRGCFHVFAPEARPAYLRTIDRLVAPGGVLLLKTFSIKQPGDVGPRRFTPEEIRAHFAPTFEVLSIDETVYQGTLDPFPHALFSVLRRRTPDGTTAIQAERALVTLINVFTVAPGGQARFAAAQTAEYRRLRGQMAGSLAANLHRGLDGVTLANVAQFRSMPEFRAWVQSDLARDHALVIRSLIERSEPGLYRPLHVSARRGDGIAFIEPTATGGPHALIVLLAAADEDRAGVAARLMEAAPEIVRDVPGVISVAVLEGQPTGLAQPGDAVRGVVGDAKVAFQGPRIAAYLQVDDPEAAHRLAGHPRYRDRLTVDAPGVRAAVSHLFEVAFVQNDDPDKPALRR